MVSRDLQGDGWPWLARDLPSLQELSLIFVPADAGEHWPAALADCTGLRYLHLYGTFAAPLPSGQYSKLQTLHWRCSGVAALPNALRAATELETLHLSMAPEHVACCTVVDSLPKLRRLDFSFNKVDFMELLPMEFEQRHADALRELRRRLRAEVGEYQGTEPLT